MHEGHHHNHSDTENSQQMQAALLQYLLKHNRGHAQELEEMAKDLGETGNLAAASAVSESVALFCRGNEALEQALKLLEDE